MVDALKLESLNVTGICPLVYQCLVPCLIHCTELKELILMPTTSHCLTDIDEFVQALDGLQLLEHFSFYFGHATPQALSKILHALAAKDLKKLSFGPLMHRVTLADPSDMERVLIANQNLTVFSVNNVGMPDMSQVFQALNHSKLKQLELVNVIETAQHATDLSHALSRNNAPVDTLFVHSSSPSGKSIYTPPGSAHASFDFVPEPLLVCSLRDGLVNCHTLKNLIIILPHVHNEDLCALATVLRENPSLRYLDVKQDRKEGDNNVDQGIIHLGEGLMQCQGIQRLLLSLPQKAGPTAQRAFLDGVKVNSSLAWVAAPFLTSGLELAFYIYLNNGPKQALNVALNLMPFVFAKAARCRIRRGKAGPPSVLYFFVRERCDLFQEAAAVARRAVN